MVTYWTWAALAAAACVAGCAQTKGAGEEPTTQAAPACEFAGTKARTCVMRGNKAICNAYVGEIGGRTHVYPDILSVPAGAGKVVVVWHLQVPGARFVKSGAEEDGPKWKGSSASEFEEGEPTEDADGAQQGRSEGRRYRIQFKNAPTGPGPHAYVIQYRRGGEIKRCDPQIVSEAG
jgi:hypothetical protein